MVTVYRLFDAGGVLLYVGCTTHFRRRMSQFKCEWWDRVETIKLATYKTLKRGLLAERNAIRSESPLFNVIHSPTPPKKSSGQLTNKELRDKIRTGNDFTVKTISERKRALMVAKILKIEIITREAEGGGYRIFIPSDVPN